MHETTADLLGRGRGLRAGTPRSVIGTGLDFDRDPVAILDAQNTARLTDLVPLRWTRMVVSPFTFYRGAAAVMAHDLAPTPVSGVRVQACGDAHLSNFGLYASPERALVFDLNDFDETHRAPWEWDVERLAASFAIASRQNGFGDAHAGDAAAMAARAYRETMMAAADRSARDLFHDMVTIETLLARNDATEAAAKVRKQRARELERAATKARQRTADQAFAKLAATGEGGELRIVQQPPLMFRPDPLPSDLLEVPERYRASALPDVESLMRRFHAVDLAVRVVGVGSVGTRCYILLCLDSTGSPLLLQAKEATTSVLEPWTSPSRYTHMGQRVVAGQRIMQAASDRFLGWTESEGRHYYVRQFRDMKGSFDVERMSPSLLVDYAIICGGVLARAHAQSCEPVVIAGYLGHGRAFDEAIGRFSLAYADQNERDHAALRDAIASGRLVASEG
ncbi:MAG: DUF2252 domain-containing protein [Propionicimonas sp.]|uniref:DUF2252 domain-containing protein n=1 Tax=Propionicimonas sp. TaxID=1955623 RepID=UPI003D0A64C2